jgi:predicted porin
MQKRIIAAAVAATISAPAFADSNNVTIYGVANVSYDVVSTGTNAAGTAGVRAYKVSSNTSRFGLKGKEDLGDGLSAIWQIEQLIAIDNAGGTVGTRNTYAGLKSESTGTVLLGRHDTPYKLSTRKLDQFADTIADNRSLLGGVSAVAATTSANAAASGKSAFQSFDGRPADVVVYISPSVRGITGAVAYVAGAETSTTAGQAKGGEWSLAGWYDVAPFYASLAHEVHKPGTAGTGTAAALAGLATTGLRESATRLGLGYTLNAVTLGLVYERTTDNFGAAEANLLGHTAFYISGKYSFGNDEVKLGYTKTGNLGVAANTGASQLSLGYDHSLSKRSTLFALYTKLTNDTAVNYGLSTNGTGGSNTQNGAGASPSAFSLGLKHTF